MKPLRVAFFTDSFHEVNGVALTSRQFVRFAQQRSLPMFACHAGPEDSVKQEGSITTFELKRGPVRWNLEHDLAIDFLFIRWRGRALAALREFQPDVIHITGPGDIGILGALAAWELKIPLVASWHTNLHEFAARRISRVFSFLPDAMRTSLGQWGERASLAICVWFYSLAKLVFAPNPELVEMLAKGTGRPACLMQRGIDTELFTPLRRRSDGTAFTIGYVGRLSPEKNVRMFADLEQALAAAGLDSFRFLIVGEGRERAWLRENLRHADLPGILRGEPLASAYASMDAFVFPSLTDTFGNVVLEAMASGVPAIVSAGGGPKFLVEYGVSGYIAADTGDFASAILKLSENSAIRKKMGLAARQAVQRFSWDSVFQTIYRNYEVHAVKRASAAAGECPLTARRAKVARI